MTAIIYGQLWEEEIEQHVSLKWNDNLQSYECSHFPIPGGKWERFHMRLTEPHPELGVQVRPGAMCCECYQKLRRLGLAPLKGTWDVAITEPLPPAVGPADDCYREYVRLYHNNVPASQITAAYDKWREACRRERWQWPGTPECGE